jgi:hypothetical protein
VDGRIEPALMEMNSGACYARTVASNFLMLACAHIQHKR